MSAESTELRMGWHKVTCSVAGSLGRWQRPTQTGIWPVGSGDELRGWPEVDQQVKISFSTKLQYLTPPPAFPQKAINGLDFVPALRCRHLCKVDWVIKSIQSWKVFNTETSGRKVAVFLFPRSLRNSILIPWVPSSQSAKSAPSWKGSFCEQIFTSVEGNF